MALNRQRAAHPWLSLPLILATCAVSVLALDNLRITGTPLFDAWILLENHYYYALLGLLLPFSFLLYKPGPRFDLLPLDLLLAAASAATCFWLFAHAEQIVDEGWEFLAPDTALYASLLLWALILEAVRRCGGTILFLLTMTFSLYPLFAANMPELLSGMSVGLMETAAYHAMSIESLLGLPFRAFANLVIGFLVFGVTLQHTGGGRFFIQLAFALFGRVRGGPAKVAVLASGFMGSMSGSVITNVLTTGQLTIPVMKRNGIAPAQAAAIEACASTGGVLLPPVMGSTAFIMATFLEIPYYQVALAAALPALLYFTALFMQLDVYAARHDLQGMDTEEIPPFTETLRRGWYYLGAFILLILLLVVLQREALAPWVATAALLILNQLSARDRLNFSGLMELVRATGLLLVEILVILSAVGLIVGALSVTGLSGTLVNDLLFVAGGSVGILLITGALTGFVLGIGMTVTAAYIFLAIVLAPALIEGGLHPTAVHLFILYWGMLSFITPPVALGAFAAASIAEANPFNTAFTAMGFGVASYLIPFLFILNPQLILADGLLPALLACVEVLPGLYLVAAASQGYFHGLPAPGYIGRMLLATGGLLLALPDLSQLGSPFGNMLLNLTAILLVGSWLIPALLRSHFSIRN